MADKSGAKFESLVGEIFAKLSFQDERTVVSIDENISGPEGSRQFDVVITTEVAGHKITTIIECKDHKRPINVTVVDAFHSKLVDVNANKGIIAARNGFSTKAQKKAKRLGISLCQIDELANRLSNPLAFLPVVVWHIEPKTFQLDLKFSDEKDEEQKGKLNLNNFISGLGLMDLVRLSLDHGKRWGNKISLEVTSELVGRELFLTLSKTEVQLESCKVEYELEEVIQYGFAKDLPEAMFMEKDAEKSTTVFLKIENARDRLEGFQMFDSFDNLPANAKGFHLRAIGVPRSLDGVGKVDAFARNRKGGRWERII